MSSVRYIINRFADQASLDTWENSQEALKLSEEVSKYSTRGRVTGVETWFSLPDLKTIGAPPKWKMAIVSFIGAYSISSVAQYILSLYFAQRPLLTNILMTIILVVGLTYFAMPLLSRLLRRWLYPRNVCLNSHYTPRNQCKFMNILSVCHKYAIVIIVSGICLAGSNSLIILLFLITCSNSILLS